MGVFRCQHEAVRPSRRFSIANRGKHKGRRPKGWRPSVLPIGRYWTMACCIAEKSTTMETRRLTRPFSPHSPGSTWRLRASP